MMSKDLQENSASNTSVNDTCVKEMMNVSLIYLQNSVDELKKAGDLKEELSEKEFAIYVQSIEIRIAYLLDITHRAFKDVFELFPENHDNLKNCYTLFKRFEKAGKLKECTCDYCKENPVDPADLKDVKTPEELASEKSASESDKSADDTSSLQEKSE